MDSAKLQKLENLISLVGESLTRDEFTRSFETVIRLVLDIEKKSLQKIENSREDLISEVEKIKKSLSSSNTKEIISLQKSTQEKLNKTISETELLMKSVKDTLKSFETKISDNKTDKRDIQNMLDFIIEKIDIFDNKIEESKLNRKEIRDALESFKIEQDKLSIEAIDGLKAQLERLEKKIDESRGGKVVGGTSQIGVKLALANLINSETPSGTINGVNKVFTTANKITTIISFKINGQSLHPDQYSVSGNTITFNNAPPASLSTKPFTIVYV